MAFRGILVVLIYLSLSLINMCESRYHHHHNHHKKHKQNPHHHRPPGPHISLPPSPPPEASPPSPQPDYTETFDVRAFGAIGDGVSDDTEAFKSAWDAACQLQSADESAILVIPSGYSFLVQSTIFTGPCETDIIFQVA